MRLVRTLVVASLAALVLALAAAAAGAQGALPFTGSNSQEPLVTGLGLLATGAAALALGRRTRSP